MCPDGLVAPHRDIWNLGVPLRDAPCSFATDDLREAWDAPPILMFAPFIGELALALAKNIDGERDPKYRQMARQVRESKQRVNAQGSAGVEMADRLLAGIRDGRYAAYGYAKPRNVKDCRVRIPIDVFEKKYIDWKNSSIKGADLEFVSVLIFESGLAAEIDAELNKASARKTHSKRGPLSSRGAIEAAIQSLVAERELPNNDLQKQNIELVRTRVHELYPGEFPKDRALSDESIRKALAALNPRRKN